jgi:hypothetical protein
MRFVLTILLAILTLALFVHLLTRNAPFRAAVLVLVAAGCLWFFWVHDNRDRHRDIMIPVVPGSNVAPAR